jgi:hypothetical protein
MGPKLLFVFGIVLAHGALGAVWVGQEPSHPGSAIASCVNSAAPLPYFDQGRGELLAMRVEVIEHQSQLLP